MILRAHLDLGVLAPWFSSVFAENLTLLVGFSVCSEGGSGASMSTC